MTKITVQSDQLSIGIEDKDREATIHIEAEPPKIKVEGHEGEVELVELDKNLCLIG